mmetsp:Transcript_19699/g.26648  ORF Transcript_19699/g.26648 Transcript_19699/m.26648 type:complete len:161 (-) Transcript_19699:337-819(-)
MLGFFGSNYRIQKGTLWYDLIHPFGFKCEGGLKSGSSIWFVDRSTWSMMLFKFHFIVIFMHTMTFSIVLWELPYRYNRLMKTPAEKKAEKKKRNKHRSKKQGKKAEAPKTDLIADIDAAGRDSSLQDSGRATMKLQERSQFFSLSAVKRDLPEIDVDRRN